VADELGGCSDAAIAARTARISVRGANGFSSNVGPSARSNGSTGLGYPDM
jgi:hypothetical protein